MTAAQCALANGNIEQIRPPVYQVLKYRVSLRAFPMAFPLRLDVVQLLLDLLPRA